LTLIDFSKGDIAMAKRATKRNSKKTLRGTSQVEEVGPLPPAGRPHKSVQDVRAQFAALSAKQPVDEGFKAAFIESKIALAHTHPMTDLAARELAVKSVINRLGSGAPHAFAQLMAKGVGSLNQPVPGGVGYGVFYNPAFKTGWGHGTALAFDIVCPTPPGGNVNTWLYLTATNRSAMGVEAFISYNGQNDTHFRVFDWARSDQWQTDIPLSGLSNYLTMESAHGHPYSGAPGVERHLADQRHDLSQSGPALQSRPARMGPHLPVRLCATDAQQKTGWVGSWAPIVETFQPLYTNTSPMAR